MKGRITTERGKYVITIEAGKGPDGKRKRHVYRQPEGTTKRQAERELIRLLREQDTGSYTGPTKATLGAFLTEWIDGPVRVRVAPKTLETYRMLIEKRIIPALGHHRLDALTPVQIEAAWVALLDGGRLDHKPGAGVSPKTIRHIHGVLSVALSSAVKQGLIASNPCQKADLPRLRPTKPIALDADQIVRLLDATRGTPLFLPVLLAVTLGLRRGEVLALRWQDVDLETGVITIAQATEQITGRALRFKEPKSGRPRKINAPAFLLDELRAARAAAGRIHGLVICHDDGRPRLPSVVTQQFGRLVRSLEDFPPARYHDLRHSAATLLLSRGVPLPVVSEILGHADVAVTARVYSHVLDPDRRAAADTLDSALRLAQGG